MQNNGTDATKSLFQKIQSMSVSEKLDLARKAGKDARSILMRDSNKIVQLTVIASPKITESEVLIIASNRQINDDVLRHIATKKEWMKNYQIKLALVNNPKTPLSIALRQVFYLNQRDLALLSKSRAVPRPIIIAAQQRLKVVKR
jgi:phosphoribosyl-dephospho-CoA transferase